MEPIFFRPVRLEDAEAIREIYKPFVLNTAVSFEEEAPDGAEIGRRILASSDTYPWIVAEVEGAVVGYAYASQHRARESYRWAVDVTVYLADGFRRLGIGKRLYSHLIEILREQGFYRAFAGITLPNPASVALHEAMGFERIALYEDVGFKLGAWHTVCWLSLRLRSPVSPPKEPVPFTEFRSSSQTS